MSSAIKLTGGTNARATAEFIEYIDKFFDCLNVDNLNEGTRTKKKVSGTIQCQGQFLIKGTVLLQM